MRRATLILAILAACGVMVLAAAKPTPSAGPGAVLSKAEGSAAGRTIRGKLTPPDRVKEAYLWQRAMDLKVPLKVDPKTGEFEAAGLRLGTYDLVIRTPWGRIEGVDMTPKTSEYDALIPPEYRTEDLGKPAGGPLSDDDLKDIRHIINDVKRYENHVRDIYVMGAGDKAVALVDLMMDQPFVGRKGDEITWRVEEWYYRKQYGAWSTLRTRILYRFRVSGAEWTKWGWQFEPALGGLDITDERKEPITVEFAIPEKPVAEKGLAGDQYPPVEQGAIKDPPPKEE
jgi:hypothetical protein